MRGASETRVGGTNLALKFEHQPEHTVGRRVLGPEVNGEVADLVVRDKHCEGRAKGKERAEGEEGVGGQCCTMTTPLVTKQPQDRLAF